MSLSKLWKWYEKLVLSYCDVENSIKITIANLLTMSLFVIFNYLFYYLLLGYRDNVENIHLVLILLAFGKGRLLLFFILNRNNIKKKGENIFTFILAYFTVGIAVIIGIYYLIKDSNNYPKKESQSYTKEVNPNLLNNSNKYDYLKVK